ncbi:MAG: DPP IV N-terminal domain-containing protein, partial [Longimicrobiales bacterium]
MRVKKLGTLWRALALILLGSIAVSAQTPDPSLLTLERLYASREFASERFGPARWLEDGSGYTTLEVARSGTRAFDIVRFDPETGASEVLVAAESLRPTGAASPLVVEDYAWSADGSKLLIFTNTRRVWRDNTRGDYWVLDLADGDLRKLGGNAEEATLMFAKFSPQGDRVGYVNQNDLYVERLSDGSVTRLTDNGSPTMING